jgi:tight adherence protein B
VSPLSTDRVAAVEAVAALVAGGETALYDAVLTAAAQFPVDRSARRVLVVLSDGGDTVSASTRETAVAAVSALEADTTMIALGSSEADPAALAGLAAAGGGHVVPAGDPSALAAIYDRIAALLENQYRLSFAPIPGAPGEADIRIAGLDLTLELSFPANPAPTTAAPTPTTVAADDAAALPTDAVTVTAPDGIRGELGLVLGLATIAVALFILGLLLLLPDRRRARLLPRSLRLPSSSPSSGVERVKERATGFADRALDRSDRRRGVEAALDAAGIALRPAEFVVIAALAAVGGAAIGLLVAGLLGALLLGAAAILGCRTWLGQRASARRRKFADQLPATLQLLSGTLRTGYAIQQAVETVAIESESPTADEFNRLVTEHRLGRDFGVSLRAMGDRMRCREFDLVVQAVEIHRSVGGDLAEVLDNVAATVRDRNYLRRQVAALSAEGRISAYILLALPVAVFGLMLMTSNDYAALLLEEPSGRVSLGIAIGLMIVGFVWLRRLIRLRF